MFQTFHVAQPILDRCGNMFSQITNHCKALILF